MEQIVFADGWEQIFTEAGLCSIDDFFALVGDETVNRNTKRQVDRFTLGDGDEAKTFFIKRFFKPHFKDMIFSRLNFGKVCSQGQVEWKNADLLLNVGVGTYQPVCFGQRMNWVIESRSFFVTRQLQSQCLADFVAEKWLGLERSEKEKIITSLAKVFRRVHDAGISLADLYVWHVFISKGKDGQYQFDIIDLHRMSRNVTNPKRQLENIGRFDHSMVDKYFDQPDRELLVTAYAGDSHPGGVGYLIDQVKKLSAAVSAKRNPKPY